MSKSQKILTTTLWGLLVIMMIALTASWAILGRERHNGDLQADRPVPPELMVPPFQLVDQEGRAFSESQMRGDVWIVNFIFTTCTGPCPLMTQRMAGLQSEIAHPRVKFLSFSVDPVTDTPEVLREYGQEHGADFERWTFLTGDEQTIHTTSHRLLLGVTPGSDDAPIIHSTRFVLVGADGRVQGYYENNTQELGELVADATRLAESLAAQERAER